MRFVELEAELEDLAPVAPLMQQLRPRLDAAAFLEVYTSGHGQGLRFTAIYDHDRPVCIAGWRVMHTTSHGRRFYVDDLVTDPASRSKGYGRAMLLHLQERARVAGCATFDLDSGVQRDAAHAFYFREGMRIRSFHFRVDL
jgi:GNAT superfamily N-acetyltransferase